MSRVVMLRRWTICAATLLVAGGLPARAQVPDSSGASASAALPVVSADSDRASARPRKTKKKKYNDVVAVTALTATLARIVEPAPVIAPEPLLVADATVWAVPVDTAKQPRVLGTPLTMVEAVARALESDSSRKAAARPGVLGTPVANAPGQGSSGSATAPDAASGSVLAPAAAAAKTSAPAAGAVQPPVPADTPKGTPLAVALAGGATHGSASAAPAADPSAPAPGSPASAAAGSPGGTAAGSGSPARPAAATAAAPAVLGTPVPGFEPDAARVAVNTTVSFLRYQLGSPRVVRAKAASDASLSAAFAHAGVPYPGAPVYLRAFKREHELEVWGQKADGSYALVKTLSICSLGGSGLGPKLHRGDEQVPEGFYHLVDFNPTSEYHLSLRLDYPNAADRARKGGDDLGGDIYLHGGCKSAGCLPLTDTGIQQVYWLAVQARSAGQQQIPIDIFPARLDPSHWAQLSQAFAKHPELLTFWADLKAGYDAFERTHRLPDIAIDASGRYRIALAH